MHQLFNAGRSARGNTRSLAKSWVNINLIAPSFFLLTSEFLSCFLLLHSDALSCPSEEFYNSILKWIYVSETFFACCSEHYAYSLILSQLHSLFPESFIFSLRSISGMQNLSISCSLVCLIILGCAALIGFFGLCMHQISAVLVTGVMYLLAGKMHNSLYCLPIASWWHFIHLSLSLSLTKKKYYYIVLATFALFTLTIIHFKRAQDHRAGVRAVDGPEDGVIGMPVLRSVLKARRFTTAWSMDLGWGGVTLCALASVAWILLSKIMRFSPIAAMIA